jgi:trk system potassium uptake protein
MRVIVVGAGRLGSQFAGVLAGAGNDVTLVDQNPATGPTLVGDGCEPTVLEEAGAHAADLLVAATGEDEDNLVISLLAKRQFGVARVVARINDDEDAWLFDDRWGVDVAVPSAAPLISLIEEATGAADTVALLRLGRAGVNLIETVIDERSAAAGHPLGDVSLPAGCVVAAVVRDGQPAAPGADFVLRPGDELLVVAHSSTDREVRAAFQ